MDDRLDLILTRLSEAVDAKDWDVGFWRWHRDLSRWQAMKYPMKRDRRVALLRLYFEIAGQYESRMAYSIERKNLPGDFVIGSNAQSRLGWTRGSWRRAVLR